MSRLITANLKLAGLGLEISSISFEVEENTSQAEIDQKIAQEFISRLEVDVFEEAGEETKKYIEAA